MPPTVTELVQAALLRRQAGQIDEAASLLERAAAADQSLLPAVGAIQVERGNARLADGNAEAAALAFRRATDLLSNDAASPFNLGVMEERLGRRAEAVAAYRESLRRDPLLAPALNNLLLLEKSAGRVSEARRSGRSALAADPGHYEAMVNLGEMLASIGEIDDARQLLMRAGGLSLAPWAALGSLGLAESLAGKIEASLTAIRRSLALQPSFRGTWNNLAGATPDLGEVVAALRRTLALVPDDMVAHSNLIFALAYAPDPDGRRFREAKRWGERHAPPRTSLSFENPRDPDRRLRIGYLSADLRQHPIAYNVEDLLRCHDRNGYEVLAYSAAAPADAVTDRIAAAVDHWREIAGLTTAEIAERIRRDRVDILVVLAGHAGANPLAVAGLGPAPVQVSFHDVSTSGVAAIDAWLTDPVMHPDDTVEGFVEKLVRLPCFYLHRPPAEAPSSEARMPDRPVTFGSFNNPLKLGRDVLDVWAGILDAVPGARLLLKYKNRFASPLVQAPIRHRLGDRVDFLSGDVGRAEQLALWNRVDIALDPFPFNGSTTSFEALWMGVPVVTLAGDRFVGRVGASLLAQIGLDDMVAPDVAGYVGLAVALAGDRARLFRLRGELRARVAASRICRPDDYARSVEAAYRGLWRDWCSRA